MVDEGRQVSGHEQGLTRPARGSCRAGADRCGRAQGSCRGPRYTASRERDGASRSSRISTLCWLTPRRSGTSTSNLREADAGRLRELPQADGGEVQAAALRGKAQLAAEVVPVLDDLERALQAAGLDPEGDSEDGLAHGVLLVFRGLRETLERNGIEEVDPKGEKFDPNSHEALSTAAGRGDRARASWSR